MKVSFEIDNRWLVGLGLLVSAFAVGRVTAGDFPTNPEIFYSGLLTDSAGNPRTAVTDLEVALFPAAAGGASVCAVSAADVDLAATRGRFRISLTDCVDDVATTDELFAELTVDGLRLPRQKLGASAYALSAQQATSAGTALFADAAGSADSAAVASLANAVGVDAVDANGIAAGAVGASEIATDAVGADEIGTDAVGADEIAAGAVGSAELAANAVSSAKIADGQVARIDLAAGVVGDLDGHEARLVSLESAFTVAGGIASQPNQPVGSWTAAAALTGTAVQDFLIDAITVNRGNDVSVAADGYIVEQPGIYLVAATWNSGNIADQCSCVVTVVKNDTTQLGATIIDRQSIGAGTDNVGDSFVHIADLAAGDVVKFRAQSSCAGTAVTGTFHVLRLM